MGRDSPARMPPPDVPDKAPEEPQSPRFNWRASTGHPYVRMLSMAEDHRCRQRRHPGTRRGQRPRRIHRNTGRLTQPNPVLLLEEPLVQRRAITGPFCRTLSLAESRRARHRPRSSVQWIAPRPTLPRRNPKRKCRLYGQDYVRRQELITLRLLKQAWSFHKKSVKALWKVYHSLLRRLKYQARFGPPY